MKNYAEMCESEISDRLDAMTKAAFGKLLEMTEGADNDTCAKLVLGACMSLMSEMLAELVRQGCLDDEGVAGTLEGVRQSVLKRLGKGVN